MKIIVDTNVLLSSLLSSPTGTLNRLLDQIRTSHSLVLSLAMAVELGAVIVRPKFAHLGIVAERAPSTFTIIHPYLPDMDDNRLLEVAVSADADIIVTGDKQLLALNTISRPLKPEHLDGLLVLDAPEQGVQSRQLLLTRVREQLHDFCIITSRSSRRYNSAYACCIKFVTSSGLGRINVSQLAPAAFPVRNRSSHSISFCKMVSNLFIYRVGRAKMRLLQRGFHLTLVL